MEWTKQELEEPMQQKWDAPEKDLCIDCVEDDFLRLQVATWRSNAKACDYCGNSRGAPVGAILEPIAKALERYYAEPGAALVIHDEGEWLADTIDTSDALRLLPLSCHKDLFHDVARAFRNDEWVPCNGYFLEQHESERLTQAWDYFEEVAKHKTRYFLELGDDGVGIGLMGELLKPLSLLNALGQAADNLGLVRSLRSQQILYRARHAEGDAPLKTFEELGPPPKGKASAGRMNPAGISYLYTATEQDTAVREVVSHPPSCVTVAMLLLKQDIVVVDLTDLPERPSVFDDDNYERRQLILFLNEFVRRIVAPVEKDGRERVEFVPSQMVSEFFSQIFSLRPNQRGIDGMVYPSAVVPNGQNVVVFPPKGRGKWHELFDLVEVKSLTIENYS